MFSSSEVQAIIEKKDKTNTGVDFRFPKEQEQIVKEWKTIKIICDNFPIVNEQLAILKPESNTILIHPTVSSFGNSCFLQFNMESIEIPNSITSLGFGCFSGCSSLKQVSLPNSIKSLGNGCFFNCVNLTKINRPSSLEKIGLDVLYDCEKLENKPF
jgi:hypothetical protein